MHDHTTKAVATLESEAPLIKAVDTLEAETILTKAVAAAPEHVGTLDVMRVTVGEESNGAITRPGEDQVPTTGDTLDRDGGRDGVAEVPTCTASLILHRLSYPAPPYPAPPSLSRAPRLTCAASLRTRIVVPQAQPHAPRHYTRGSL